MTPNEFTRAVSPRVLSNKSFNKIFCIGFNKTGTTTLAQVLSLYGYNLPNQMEQEARLTKQVYDTNYSPLLNFCNQYDAFQDLPFSQGYFYIAADALFPGSKFILTHRDSETWFESMSSYYKKKYIGDLNKPIDKSDIDQKFNYLFPGYHSINISRFISQGNHESVSPNWDLLFEKDFYIAEYERRNFEIRKYFASRPDKLLAIDVTLEKNTLKLCQFLGIPNDFVVAMPHANKTPNT